MVKGRDVIVRVGWYLCPMVQVHQAGASTDFLFLLALICLGVYSFQLKFRRKETLLILRSVFDGNVSEQLFRENSRLIERSMYTMVITGLALLGAYASWWLGSIERLPTMETQEMLIGIVCVGLVYTFRYTVLQLLGTLGNISEVTDQLVFDFKTIIAATGVMALPLVTFSIFGTGEIAKISSYVLMGILLLSICLSLFKGIAVSLRSERIKFLHLFYYFCALEIMPIAWAYRSLLN